MTLDETCRLSYYQPTGIRIGHGYELVRHAESGAFFVKKELAVYNEAVYRRLLNSPVPGLPVLREVVAGPEGLTVIEDFVNDQSLETQLRMGVSFSERQAKDVLLSLCEVVRRLHESAFPIVHRDIKPSNVLLSEDGRVTLIDLNAAKPITPHAGQDTVLMGTVGYAAPEQFGFAASGPAADIYALGVLYNVLLTGCLPRERLAEGEAGRIVTACTQMDPAGRFPSVAALMQALSSEDYGSPRRRTGVGRFAPPGFRGKEPLVYVFSSLGYLILFWSALTYSDTRGLAPAPLWINRVMLLCASLCEVAFFGNYLGFRDRLRPERIRNKAARWAFLAAVGFLILIFWVMLMMIAERLLGISEG